MRKALATLGVLAVLMFGSTVLTGCGEKSDDGGGDDSSSDTPSTAPTGD